MEAMNDFVENVQALKVTENPWIRKRRQEEMDRCLNNLIKYLRESLVDLDWQGCQGLMRIFEMALTPEREMPYEVSDLVKAHQLMEKYFETTMLGLITANGYPPQKRYFLVNKEPSFPLTESTPLCPSFFGDTNSNTEPTIQITKSTPSLIVLEVEEGMMFLEGGRMFFGRISNPTRKDLEGLLKESDRRRIKQIVRAAKTLGYTIKPLDPGPPLLK